MEETTWDAGIWDQKLQKELNKITKENEAVFVALKDAPNASKSLLVQLVVERLQGSRKTPCEILTGGSN